MKVIGYQKQVCMCEHFLFSILIAQNLGSNLVADPSLQSYGEHGPLTPLPGSATGIFTQCDMITNFLSSFRTSVCMMVYVNTQLSFSVLK